MFNAKVVRLIYSVSLFTASVCMFGAAADQLTTSALTFSLVAGLTTALAAFTALVPPKS